MTDKKLSFIFLFIFLVSCSTTSQTPINILTRLPTLTSTATVTAVPPMQTLTPTLTPTMTLTPLPSWTPLPTLVDENSFLDFISFTKNSVCKFPCWAGILPGETNWDEASFALRPMESIAKVKTYLGVEGLFGNENVITWYLSGNEVTANGDIGAIEANRNAVNLIHISVEGSSIPSENNPSHSLPLPQNFSLQSMLKVYGIPAMVFIYTFIHDEQGPLPFKVLLVYPENHFYIQYYRDAKLSGNTVVACDSDFYLELAVVDDRDKLSSADAIANTPEASIGIENWKPVEQVLNITPEKFHEIYSTSSPGCISFPSDRWTP